MSTKNLSKKPVAVATSVIGSQWRILIISELLISPKRFNELKKSLKDITQKVLTAKLRELEQDELVVREQFGSKVLYSLTDLGYSLRPVINSLQDWGKDYKKYIKLKNKLNN